MESPTLWTLASPPTRCVGAHVTTASIITCTLVQISARDIVWSKLVSWSTFTLVTSVSVDTQLRTASIVSSLTFVNILTPCTIIVHTFIARRATAGSVSRSVGTRMLTSTIVNKAFVLIMTSVCLCIKRESLATFTLKVAQLIDALPSLTGVVQTLINIDTARPTRDIEHKARVTLTHV